MFFYALASDPRCRDAVQENRPSQQQDEDSEESDARHDVSKLQLPGDEDEEEDDDGEGLGG